MKEESVDPKIENQVVALRLWLSHARCQMRAYRLCTQYAGRILGIIGQDPSNSFQVLPVTCWNLPVFIYWFRSILQIPRKWWVIFLKSWFSTSYFLNSNGSSVYLAGGSPHSLCWPFLGSRSFVTDHHDHFTNLGILKLVAGSNSYNGLQVTS